MEREHRSVRLHDPTRRASLFIAKKVDSKVNRTRNSNTRALKEDGNWLAKVGACRARDKRHARDRGKKKKRKKKEK